ncbi:hypothetical protein K2173_014668 [Erythroxylum novogranatense]|uniref:Pentatricopeptide repeat-containing protein n=1 Tax=Erythroxylum novogranatense TaxID=1862640 RepID=A0AAV8TFF2_9ROSI|nr:hypothetical protein K2173_014668 [Erythroxylum novogranatense]
MRNRRRLLHQLAYYRRTTSKQDFPFSTFSNPSLVHSHNKCRAAETRRLQLAYLLQLSTHNKLISHPKQIHAHVLVSGLESNVYFSNVLLRCYASSGFLCYARKLFDKMPEKNSISWSSMVSIYSKYGFYEEALVVFLEFRRCCFGDTYECILASVLRACAGVGGDNRGDSIGKQVHGLVIKVGFDQDIYVGSSLIDFYVKGGEIDEGKGVFDCLLEKSMVTWTTMITGYAKNGKSEKSLQLFNQMMETDVVPDKYVLSSVLSACAAFEFFEGGKQIHGHVFRRGIEMDVSVSNVLIDLYMKCGKVQNARKIFDLMIGRDVVSWTTMISGYMQNSFDAEAIELFFEMTSSGWKPDGFTCTSILTSCGSLEALKQGKQVHAYSIKTNLQYELFVGNSLIDMYGKCNSLANARRVFNSMTDHNMVSYNAIIEGYARNNQLSEALDMFYKMRLKRIRPSLLTFVSLIGVSAALSTLNLTKQIHVFVVKLGLFSEIFSGTALIDAYSKSSSIPDARLVFDDMKEKDIVVWNAMIFGYIYQWENEEALKLYCDLQLSEQKSNIFTFAALITASSHLASLQRGQQFHGHLIKMGLVLDPVVLNSLIDMYAKCGSFEDACKTFDSAIDRDIVCWNTMILTYAHHGEAEEALELFERMKELGLKPNYVTFLGVLSACSHAGRIADGFLHFESMLRFGVDPGIEHYASMVSLLGRAGRVYEAIEFIEKMPINPGAVIWRSLLSACRVSGDVEVGKYAAEMAISMDPTDSGSYAMLSNIFASKGMWEDARSVRQTMDLNRVVKETGHSWIEVDKEVNVFVARDRTHDTEHICSLLDNLIPQTELPDSVPDNIALIVNG